MSRDRLAQALLKTSCHLGIGMVLLSGLWLEAGWQPVQAQTASQGYTLLQRGWVNDAIAAFQAALQRDPKSLEARLGLAIAYQRAGKDAAAWESYQFVLRQDPANRTALLGVGVLGGYRSEWQSEGIAALTTLLQRTPNDMTARSQRGLLLGYQGRFAEALADYELVLQTNPKPDMILGAAQTYTYSSDAVTGLALFQRYLRSQTTIPDGALSAYALALQQTGQVDQSIKLLQSRLQSRSQLDFFGIEWRTALALAYQAKGDTTTALATLATLQQKPEATLARARALSTIGRQQANAALYQEAIDLYRQALSRSPQPPANLLIEIADVMSETNATQAEALQLYQRGLQQQPHNVVWRLKSLILAAQQGQISAADMAQQIQAVTQPLPPSAVERRSLALALIKLDPPHSALQATYEALLQAGVDVPFLHYRLAQLHLQAGNLEATRQALQAYQATPVGAKDVAVDLLFAELERQQGNLDASGDRYTAVLAQNPPNAIYEGALQGLIAVRQAQGRVDEALQLYDQMIARNPTEGRWQLGKTALAYQAQQLSQTDAETVVTEWLQSRPGQTPAELVALVSALPANPQWEGLYQQLIDRTPTNVALQTRLIQIIAKRDVKAARARIDDLIARNPDDITAYFIKGELEQSQGQLPAAAQAYLTILQKQPDQVGALSALAGVRFQQKQFQAAEVLYQRVLALRPHDWETRRSLAELSAAQDYPFTALRQFQQLERERSAANGTELRDRIERLQVDQLKRRGFQPPWEQY